MAIPEGRQSGAGGCRIAGRSSSVRGKKEAGVAKLPVNESNQLRRS